MSEPEVSFEADLEATPDTVWRVLSEAELRAEWLDPETAAALQPIETDGERRLRFRDNRDQSLVTFAIEHREGGARLTITHVAASAEVIAFPAPAAWRMAA